MAEITIGELTLRCVDAQRYAEFIRSRDGPVDTLDSLRMEKVALSLKVELQRRSIEKDQEEMADLRRQRDEIHYQLQRDQDQLRRARFAIRREKEEHYRTRTRLMGLEGNIAAERSAGKETIRRLGGIHVSPSLLPTAAPEKTTEARKDTWTSSAW